MALVAAVWGTRGKVVRGQRGKVDLCQVPGAPFRASWPWTPVSHSAGQSLLQVSVSAPMVALAYCPPVMEGGAVLCLQGWVPAGWASNIQPATLGSAMRPRVPHAWGCGEPRLCPVCGVGCSSRAPTSGVLEHRQEAVVLGPLRPELGKLRWGVYQPGSYWYKPSLATRHFSPCAPSPRG